MNKKIVLTIFALLTLATFAQADVIVTSASPAWVQISANTFGLPATIPGCGQENELTCEPTGIFNFNVGFTTSGILNIVEADGSISDQVVFGNNPLTGLGLVTFTDASVGGILADGVTVCVESASSGCVHAFNIGIVGGSDVILTLASDGESQFDPFGLGADTSDQLQVTGGATIGTATPEPGSLFLLGTGLLGMGGAVRRKFKV